VPVTELLRRRIACRFRELLDSGIHRKAAFRQLRLEHGVSRRSVYRYCREFRVSTR
jgi:predicted transcriptional regulator YheO